ncbi:MAG: class I SAM-dependent methyltransferase [Trueperaceae bacterium]|nr:class I SAM-dependent methyltransferase [Trueperaceae bacterium]
MQLSDAEALISGGVGRQGGTWADLGCGSGTFTLALARLLGEGGTVHAVDKESSALSELALTARDAIGAGILTTVADFTWPLPLSGLDGVVMANSLHFVERGRQEQVVALVSGYLREGGALVLVEYDQVRGNPWVPYPVPPRRFADLARAVGLAEPVEIGRRRSR